ncbi:unnamed protein product [Zymoseptoria tritici ST99CH_1E4]|uniref:AAA+ ATPase domain-containing protein n=1 Tax=Zymoseptoria tritici ST99CH_1E4 TaxID=1276532 RepID=A0A2H1FYH0_ZYMTR|nr:unnamed protein product [Zymoseptoria tritici ST99CH_1E4]
MYPSSSPQDIPGSDELDDLHETQQAPTTASTAPTTFSDDLEALNEVAVETKRAKNAAGVVVQHRSWNISDVFHSDAQEKQGSSPVAMPYMASSPPLTPSPIKKRKFADIDLGTSSLGLGKSSLNKRSDTGATHTFEARQQPVDPQTHTIKAQRSYFGIDIHRLLEDAQAEETTPKPTVVDLPTPPAELASKTSSLLWTEKYRAKKFTDLIGDERTHRAVMHWLKRWDQIVFPGSYRPKKPKGSDDTAFVERPLRKILLLTGPPGLGKTTLAHVCAKQAGYEVQEINASDERSSSVVKGRIRDMVGTENVKGIDTKTASGHTRKAGKPVCVIVDEVDGVVGGSGGSGEGGFVKALIDLIMLDQKNSTPLGSLQQAPTKKKKGERFRMLRPLILVCNDVYHPSLRPLRNSSVAEVIRVGKAPVQNMISRLHGIFQKEGVPCETDGVRRLCEATWGVSNRKEDRHGSGSGEGDMRGIMVVGEWVAGKLRASNDASLTRKWVEDNVLKDLAHDGGAARGLGRGGPKDIVDRVFQEGAGFPKQSNIVTSQHTSAGNTGVKGVAEGIRRTATGRLRELINTHGDTDRIMSDCFSSYPDHPFQDDTLLSKPDSAYEWLHFHDKLSSAVFTTNEWELAPYLSTPILAFHHLFASPTRSQYIAPADAADDEPAPHPFSGPGASWVAYETEKQNSAHLQTLQSSLSVPLSRCFSSVPDLATDLQPFLLRMLTPSINPIIVGGSNKDKSIASVRKASEQTLVKRAVNAMSATGVRFDRVKVTDDSSSRSGGGMFGGANEWIYRMEPPLDTLCTFETGGKGFGDAGASKTRFAVRQVLDQEWKKEEFRLAEEARLARLGVSSLAPASAPSSIAAAQRAGAPVGDAEAMAAANRRVAKDFFGRPVKALGVEAQKTKDREDKEKMGPSVWVAFHEGYSNAVRKPIGLREFLREL